MHHAPFILLLVTGCYRGDPAPARPEPVTPPTRVTPVKRQLAVAGHALVVPPDCQLAEGGGSDLRSWSIRCPRAVLDWLDGTGNNLDGAVRDLATPTLTVVDRLSIGCEVASIEGDGVIATVEEAGNRTPVFLCVVPYGGAYSVVRCVGYDPRVRPSGDPPVPEPCNQVVPWQPVLVGP